MDQDTQFWLTWTVRLAGTVATFLAVVVALFGEKLRSWLFHPRLVLELESTTGHRTDLTIKSNEFSRQELGRYYNVCVRNEVRWPAATQLQVFLLRIEEPGPDRALQVKWSGAIPLQWQNQEIHELRRTVGPTAVADLCRVIRGKWLDVTTIVYPSAAETYRLRRVGSTVDMTVVLQARSTEGASPVTSFRITWDGQWEDGDAEMARHLIIKAVRPEPAIGHY